MLKWIAHFIKIVLAVAVIIAIMISTQTPTKLYFKYIKNIVYLVKWRGHINRVLL